MTLDLSEEEVEFLLDAISRDATEIEWFKGSTRNRRIFWAGVLSVLMKLPIQPDVDAKIKQRAFSVLRDNLQDNVTLDWLLPLDALEQTILGVLEKLKDPEVHIDEAIDKLEDVLETVSYIQSDIFSKLEPLIAVADKISRMIYSLRTRAVIQATNSEILKELQNLDQEIQATIRYFSRGV